MKTVFAVAAHPDDIEFMMAGTLLRLRNIGYEIHYMNIANGCLGSNIYDAEELAEMREKEAKKSCKTSKAVFHKSICADMEIYFEKELVSKVASIVREVEPEIVLVQHPLDYMEDHRNAQRIAIQAVFARGLKNFICNPPKEITNQQVAIYHAVSHGLHDYMRNKIIANYYIDIEEVLEEKKLLLSCHESQQEWLEASQGLNSYINDMINFMKEMGRDSCKYKYAEGWLQHSHLGFSTENFNPLSQLF